MSVQDNLKYGRFTALGIYICMLLLKLLPNFILSLEKAWDLRAKVCTAALMVSQVTLCQANNIISHLSHGWFSFAHCEET